MTISPLALGAKKVIDAAWLHGDAYDLSSQAAFALESAQLLMTPEVAAELGRLRGELAVSEQRSERRRIAWRMARTRALSTGGAADRYAARAREVQTALQDMLAALLTAQIERDAARARVAELEAEKYVAPSPSCTRCYGADAARFVAEGGATAPCPVCGPSEVDRLRARVAELESERHSTNEALADLTLAQRSADKLTALFAPTQALREDEPAPKCRCDEPGADPYACEADDCTGEFSELNPFGGGPVHGHDAKVSRTCKTCGWKTSVWHVDDGSAEEELHSHGVRIHGGVS